MSIRSWASSQPDEGFRTSLPPCLTMVKQTWGTLSAVFFNPWVASEDPAQDLVVILMIHYCGERQSRAYFTTGLPRHPHSTLPSADALIPSRKDETAGATEWLTGWGVTQPGDNRDRIMTPGWLTQWQVGHASSSTQISPTWPHSLWWREQSLSLGGLHSRERWGREEKLCWYTASALCGSRTHRMSTGSNTVSFLKTEEWSSALQVTWGVGVMAYSLASTPGCCWRRRGIPLHIVQV